ncbi:MAG: endonuclease/exonuclease/phosphatase family protein [Solirubrobacteraceae bacterium]
MSSRAVYAAVRVLTWNLFHGRAVPGAGRDLLDEFSAALASWAWDVALLQEVPPWWPSALGRACDAQCSAAPTSRNALAPARRAIATRAPDLVKSNGGGANAILVRNAHARIVDERRVLLRRWPERRVCHAVALDGGTWCANLHAQVHSVARAQADIERAAAAALAWARDAPVLLGGDCNIPAPAVRGMRTLGGRGVDHVLGRGLVTAAPDELPDRGALSDHPAVIVTVLPRAAAASR